jgi:methylthioribulose-1-phosphate dehydratase
MQNLDERLLPYRHHLQALQEVGHHFWTRGWSLGTSSNYSIVIDRDPLRLLITASGKDKGHLQPNDFVIVDQHGQRVPPDQPASSAETLLHCSAAAQRQAGAILHTHSLWSTLLSDRFFALGGIMLEGFEMLKGLEGIKTHQARVWLPIFENTQDIPALQREVERSWQENPEQACWGYLIRRHGMYTWGKNIQEAARHIEVLEFLLECVGRQISLAG